MNKEFRFIDLFSGLGGFRVALENLGGKCVFSSDIDKYSRETYKMNFGEYPHGDIKEIDEKNIPDHDILCAGFPCQPFSIAGKRLGFEDERGTLFLDVIRIVNEKKPSIIFLENVAGIVNHDNGNTIEVIKSLLTKSGYKFKTKTLNSKDYGYPQNRNRWYCIGIKNSIYDDFYNEELIKFPLKKDLYYKLENVLESNVSNEYDVTATARKNILTHLPNYYNNKRYSDNYLIIANEVRKSRCHFRSDGISPCLTAKMGTGGNNVPVVVSQMRKFTERECLKLMGFPDWYIIKKNNCQSYKQIGNSVVVPIVQEIVKMNLNFLKKT